MCSLPPVRPRLVTRFLVAAARSRPDPLGNFVLIPGDDEGGRHQTYNKQGAVQARAPSGRCHRLQRDHQLSRDAQARLRNRM